MSTNSLRQYIDANASLPKEVVLGNLAWFEVKDGAYAAADLESGFVRHSLNPGFLPGPINPADAYEKASKGAEGLKYPVSLPGGTTGQAVILVRDVARTTTQIQRQLIREVKDESAKVLAYDKVGEFVFYRPVEVAGKIDHASARVRATLDPNLTPEERTLLSELVKNFNADFDRYRNFHDGQKLRGILRNYLRSLNGTLMKSSVYFVHVTRADELQRLQQFTAELTGASIALWQIPDLQFHREEVIAAFEEESVKEFTGLVAEVQKIRASRKGGATLASLAKLKVQYDEIAGRGKEYSRTMEISQDKTAAAAEMALDALVQLRTEILNAEKGGA